jgi:hypothetical protein
MLNDQKDREGERWVESMEKLLKLVIAMIFCCFVECTGFDQSQG